MGTVVGNNRVGSALERDVAPIDTTVASGAINAGDMIYVTGNSPNGVASLNTPGASNANAANFIGVSRDAYPIPYSDGLTETVPTGTTPSAVFYKEGFFRFNTTATQTYAPGASVYLGANGQTVSTTATGTTVGQVAWDQTPVGGTLGGSITGAAGQQVVILIKPAYEPEL